MYSFSYLKPVCCSMSSSNCCFLICIQMSQEAGQVVWYSHLFQNFPQFIVIHTVKGLDIVSKAEIDVFLQVSFFFDDPADVGNLISGSSAFSKTSLNIWKFMVHVLLKPGLENFEHYFTSLWDECRCPWLLWKTDVQNTKTRDSCLDIEVCWWTPFCPEHLWLFCPVAAQCHFERVWCPFVGTAGGALWSRACWSGRKTGVQGRPPGKVHTQFTRSVKTPMISLSDTGML